MDKVVCVGLTRIFDAKVVHNKSEHAAASVVFSEGMGSRDRSVSIYGEVFAQAIVCNSVGLF